MGSSWKINQKIRDVQYMYTLYERSYRWFTMFKTEDKMVGLFLHVCELWADCRGVSGPPVRALVLDGEWFCPRGDPWHRLQIFLVVASEGCYWHLVGEAEDAAKHSAAYWTAPHNQGPGRGRCRGRASGATAAPARGYVFSNSLWIVRMCRLVPKIRPIFSKKKLMIENAISLNCP